MGIQTKVLQTAKSVSVKKIPTGGAEQTATLTGRAGTLALGKPGDIITRAYGPVVRSAVVTTDNTAFGSYVAGNGILVNSNDCAGIGTKFETVTALKAGQVGSFLVSGACVVKTSQISAINAGMKIQSLDYGTPFSTDNWKTYTTWAVSTDYKVGDVVKSGENFYVCTVAHTSASSGTIDTTKFTTGVAAHGSSAAYSEFGDYSYAFCLVTKDSVSYTNPVAIESVCLIEVNGFETEPSV